MAWAVVTHEAAVTVAAAAADVAAFLQMPERWAPLQPFVRRAAREPDGTVAWEFEEMVVAGLHLRPAYRTRFTDASPAAVCWTSVDSGGFRCEGCWALRAIASDRTQLSVAVTFAADIPLHAALIPLAKPAAQREFARQIDQLLANLAAYYERLRVTAPAQ